MIMTTFSSFFSPLMLRRCVVVGTALLLSVNSMAAFAGGKSVTSPFKPFKPMNQQQGHDGTIYLGASIGATELQESCDTAHCVEGDQAWKLYAGYQMNHELSLEGGYVNLGQFQRDATQTTEVKGLEASLVAYMPVHEQVNLFAKAGVFKWESDIAHDHDKYHRDDLDPMFGVGVDYRVSDNVKLRGEWDSYRSIALEETGTSSDISLLGAGVTFTSF